MVVNVLASRVRSKDKNPIFLHTSNLRHRQNIKEPNTGTVNFILSLILRGDYIFNNQIRQKRSVLKLGNYNRENGATFTYLGIKGVMLDEKTLEFQQIIKHTGTLQILNQ